MNTSPDMPSSRPMTTPQSDNTGSIPDQTIKLGAVTLRQQLDKLMNTYPQSLKKFKDNSPTAYSGFKDAIESLCQEIAREARFTGAEALAARIHKHKPQFHTPDKCKLCAVVDGHLSILKAELTQKEKAK